MNGMHVSQLFVIKVNQYDGRGRLEEEAWDGSRAYAHSHICLHESNAYLVILKKGNHQVQGIETHYHNIKKFVNSVFTRVGLHGPTPCSRS